MLSMLSLYGDLLVRVPHFIKKGANFQVLTVILLAFSFLYFQNWVGSCNADVLSPFGQVDYQGTYVVEGNETEVIEGRRYIIFGSVHARDNATLIVRNVNLGIHATKVGLFQVINQARLIVENSTVSALEWEWQEPHGWSMRRRLPLILKDQAECYVSRSKFSSDVSTKKDTNFYAIDSVFNKISGANISLHKCNITSVESSDSTFLDDASIVSIMNSSIKNLDAGLNSNIIANCSTIDFIRLKQETSSIINISNSDVGLDLNLTQKNLMLTIKPFFANSWNLRRETPINMPYCDFTLHNSNLTKIRINFYNSSVSLVNSKLYSLTCRKTSIYILGCSVENHLTTWNSTVYLLDSTLQKLDCYNSNITSINSICPMISTIPYAPSTVEIWWSLKITLNDQVENPKANTMVSVFDKEGILIDAKPIDESGLTQFTLLQKRIANNKTEDFGSYVIYANYGAYSIKEDIDLKKSVEVFLTVTPFIAKLTNLLASNEGTAIIVISIIVVAVSMSIFRKRYLKRKLEEAIRLTQA